MLSPRKEVSSQRLESHNIVKNSILITKIDIQEAPS